MSKRETITLTDEEMKEFDKLYGTPMISFGKRSQASTSALPISDVGETLPTRQELDAGWKKLEDSGLDEKLTKW